MSNLTELIDRYIETWNETNSDRRRDLIARTWTEDAIYIDPLMCGEGRKGIDTMIQGVQSQFPGCRIHRTSDIDLHNGRLRFTWELKPENGPALAGGVDFGIVSDGQLHSITGFIDYAQPLSEPRPQGAESPEFATVARSEHAPTKSS